MLRIYETRFTGDRLKTNGGISSDSQPHSPVAPSTCRNTLVRWFVSSKNHQHPHIRSCVTNILERVLQESDNHKQEATVASCVTLHFDAS